ncbi:MAG: glycine cleavage system protein GcvH [Chloroflexi bacterium]|nr:MAG: glycine cleavage system protein GcvH [Chloroflexota bacterium]
MGKWKTPDDLKYTESDEWIRVEGDTATIGITDYAQDQLNDIVYVELPDVGDAFDKNSVFGTIESVKAAADLHLPVGGEVVAVNDGLEDDPEIINADPYGNGWIIKIKVADASELDSLMDAAAYAKLCEERD